MKYSKNSFARFIPIILVVIITIVALIAVILIGRSLLGGGTQTTEVGSGIDEGREALLSTDVTRSVRVTVRGPIVADEARRSYRITISPESRVMTTYEGYLEQPIDTKVLDNNSVAYTEFVHALDKRRMMDGRVLTDQQNDLRGICASQKIYEMETLVNGETVRHLWTSDCKGSPGSALANINEIFDMFLKQIPGGRKMASDVGLTQQETFFRL